MQVGFDPSRRRFRARDAVHLLQIDGPKFACTRKYSPMAVAYAVLSAISGSLRYDALFGGYAVDSMVLLRYNTYMGFWPTGIILSEGKT